ncbi:hypothetical protein [Goodfellowiella coeruleoviolacea]|uniref:hypothetical protein n=1 Tax=Goodfellowiella coeruleoviolacea TaxID=334858 RepID=UPI0020A3BD50|nr:hypothetical protein [Goodfellowiella coeruleoviolacea]
MTAVVGALWWARPSSYPFGPGDRVTVTLSHFLDHDVAGPVVLLAGLLGLVAAGLALRRPGSPCWFLRVVALLEVGLFGLVLSDAGVMSLFGYLAAVATPAVVLAVVVMSCLKRQWPGLLVLSVVAVLIAVGVTTGLLSADTLASFAHNLAAAFSLYLTRLMWTAANAVVAVHWLFHALRSWGVGRGRRAALPDWATPGSAARWGRIATIGAALCPLPYALYRLTWLTPWPVGGTEAGPADLGTRLQGSLIGVAALLACVPILGLISRWGEVFPGWVPRLRGRPVPPMLAVIPGGVVALACCLSAPGVVVGSVLSGSPLVLLFPYPVWGPLLGAAVLAYWLRRRQGPAPAVPGGAG